MVESLSDRLKRDINKRVNYKMAMLRRYGMEKDAILGLDTIKNIGAKTWNGIKSFIPSWDSTRRFGKGILDNTMGIRTTWDPNKSKLRNIGSNIGSSVYTTMLNRPVKSLTGVSLGDWWAGISGKGKELRYRNQNLPLLNKKGIPSSGKQVNVPMYSLTKDPVTGKNTGIRGFSASEMMDRNLAKSKKYIGDKLNKRWALQDPNKTQGLRSEAMQSMSDAITDKAVDTAANNGMIGALGGAAVGGIGGALSSDDKDRFRNGMMGALAGAGLGGVAGAGLGGLNTLRRGNALKRYVRQGGLQFNGNGDVVTLNTPGRLLQTFMPERQFKDLGGWQRLLYTNHGNVDQFADNMMNYI